jgi:hypothetical protein
VFISELNDRVFPLSILPLSLVCEESSPEDEDSKMDRSWIMKLRMAKLSGRRLLENMTKSRMVRVVFYEGST